MMLLLKWLFDQFVYPVWQALFPPKGDDGDGDEQG
jgi:hypothetical protein